MKVGWTVSRLSTYQVSCTHCLEFFSIKLYVLKSQNKDLVRTNTFYQHILCESTKLEEERTCSNMFGFSKFIHEQGWEQHVLLTASGAARISQNFFNGGGGL